MKILVPSYWLQNTRLHAQHNVQIELKSAVLWGCLFILAYFGKPHFSMWIQAHSQKILLGCSFKGNVDVFLLQPFSQPQSRRSWWAYILWCVRRPHLWRLVNPSIDNMYSWNIHKKPTIKVLSFQNYNQLHCINNAHI